MRRSIVLSFLGTIVLFTTPAEVELSVWMGDLGWGHLISSSVFLLALPEVQGVLWFQVEVHSTWNLEQYTLAGTSLVPDVFDAVWISRKLHYFRFVIEGGVMFSDVIPPV